MFDLSLSTELQSMSAKAYGRARYMLDRNSDAGREMFRAAQIIEEQNKAADYAESARFWLGLNADAVALSEEFRAVVQVCFSADELKTIDARNQTPEYAETGSCATHDFCDANELMAQAFETTFRRPVDLESDTDTVAWNSAWEMATKKGFSRAGLTTLADIQTAVRAGHRVHWRNEGYTVGRWVRRDHSEQWLIVHANGSATGLTRADGVTMTEAAADFFIGE